ncbi:MAG: hypothetical protein NTX97_05055, partial [Bacteroidetes bacterium]|nr:hypothetical protein [Bacteroidota bacterium]
MQINKSEQVLSIQLLKEVAVSSEKFNTTNGYGFNGEVGTNYFFKDGSCLKIGKEHVRFGTPKKFMEFIDARGVSEINVKRLSEKHI